MIRRRRVSFLGVGDVAVEVAAEIFARENRCALEVMLKQADRQMATGVTCRDGAVAVHFDGDAHASGKRSPVEWFESIDGIIELHGELRGEYAFVVSAEYALQVVAGNSTMRVDVGCGSDREVAIVLVDPLGEKVVGLSDGGNTV